MLTYASLESYAKHRLWWHWFKTSSCLLWYSNIYSLNGMDDITGRSRMNNILEKYDDNDIWNDLIAPGEKADKNKIGFCILQVAYAYRWLSSCDECAEFDWITTTIFVSLTIVFSKRLSNWSSFRQRFIIKCVAVVTKLLQWALITVPT